MLSSRFSAKIASAARRFLQHKCTLVTWVASLNIDEEGNTIYTEQATSDIPCLFLWADVTTTDERGVVVEHKPLLYLLNSESVQDNNEVRNVLSRNGINILTSAKIQDIDTTAEGGNAALKVCTLSGATV